MRWKASGILFLFCLVAPIAASFIFLHYQKKQIREEVKSRIVAGIDEKELVLLKITQEESHTDLRWEHSAEFEYNGQMYDVVEEEIRGDTIYYLCWWDHKETELNKHLDNLLSYALGNNKHRSESKKRVKEFYQSLFFVSRSERDLIVVATKPINTLYKLNYQSVSYPPPVPPPEIC